MNYSQLQLCNEQNDVKGLEEAKMTTIRKETRGDSLDVSACFYTAWLLDLNIVDRRGFCVVQLAW